MARLTGRQISELRYLEPRPGLWARVDPTKADRDLLHYLERKLVEHIGPGKGYRITEAGRSALKSEGEI